MRVAIVGSREAGGFTVDGMIPHIPQNTSELVSGGAAGIDTIAEQAARALALPITIFAPDYGANGKLAPLIRNQKIVEIKEVQLSMTIDMGDLNVKAKQATRFLNDGNKVKVSIRLRGRQMAHANLGRDVMNNFFEGLKEIAVIEKPINMEGRNIIMILAPKKS